MESRWHARGAVCVRCVRQPAEIATAFQEAKKWCSLMVNWYLSVAAMRKKLRGLLLTVAGGESALLLSPVIFVLEVLNVRRG